MAKDLFFRQLQMTSLINTLAQKGESPENITDELTKKNLPVPENLAATVANIRATALSAMNPNNAVNHSSSDNMLPALG